MPRSPVRIAQGSGAAACVAITARPTPEYAYNHEECSKYGCRKNQTHLSRKTKCRQIHQEGGRGGIYKVIRRWWWPTAGKTARRWWRREDISRRCRTTSIRKHRESRNSVHIAMASGHALCLTPIAPRFALWSEAFSPA